MCHKFVKCAVAVVYNFFPRITLSSLNDSSFTGIMWEKNCLGKKTFVKP